MKLTAIEQHPLHPLTWITFITTILVFLVATIILANKLKIKNITRITNFHYKISKKKIIYANVLLLITELIIYFFVYSLLPTIPMLDDEVRAFLLPQVVGNIGLTVMTLPIFLIIFNTIFCINEKRYYILFFNAIYIILLISLGARITIFIPFVTTLFYMLICIYFMPKRKKELSLVAVLTSLFVFLAMLAVPILRTQIYHPTSCQRRQINRGLTYYKEIYAKDYSTGLDLSDFSPPIKLPNQLLPIWVQFSTEIYGFNGVVESLNETNRFQNGKMFLTGTFGFISKYFIEKPQVSDTIKIPWVNVCTFLQEPYLDFGILGVAAFVLAYAAAAIWLYVRAISNTSLFFVIYYSYFSMITIFLIFANHFYISTFIINTILLYLLSKFFVTKNLNPSS